MGLADGRLLVFQSRDAIVPEGAATTGPTFEGRRCQPLAVGYAVGGAGSIFGAVEVLEHPPGASELHAAADVAAIVVRRGGPSSHSASMCRERRIPTVRVEGEVSPDVVYAIDALHGTIAAFESLPVATAKRVVFAAAQTAARRGAPGWTAVGTYEAVVLDPLDQALLCDALLDGRAPEVLRQTIVPFDDPARTYTGTSIRLQRTDGITRLQLKRANVLPDRPMRFDEEVRLEGVDEAAVAAALGAMGYVPFPEQERVIERWRLDALTVLRMTWPGARHPYVGIEAEDPSRLVAALASVGLDPSMLAALDGKELFDLLGVRLDRARFEEVRDVA